MSFKKAMSHPPMTQLALQFDSPGISLKPQHGSTRQIALAGGLLSYGFVRARRHSLSIVVGRHGIEVRAPRWVAHSEVEAFIRAKEPWIRRRMQDYRHQGRSFSWADGECLPMFGRQIRLLALRLAISPEARNVVHEEDCLVAHLHASDGTEQLRNAVLAWLRAAALAHFQKRVSHYAERLGVPAPSIRLSNARTQWGSCHASGRILLHWRLIHVPERLIDYVVAHEIAHLREMNHSPRFWSLVESVYPGCQAARRELNLLEKQLPEL